MTYAQRIRIMVFAMIVLTGSNLDIRFDWWAWLAAAVFVIAATKSEG